MSVEFLPHITISRAFQTLVLKSFIKKKTRSEIDCEQLLEFKIVFSYFFVAKQMSIAQNISCYMRVMCTNCIRRYDRHIGNKFS